MRRAQRRPGAVLRGGRSGVIAGVLVGLLALFLVALVVAVALPE